MEKEQLDTLESAEEQSFEEMFEQSFKDAGRLEPGQKVEARVLKISGDWVFLDTGRKGEGVLDRKEILDDEGNLTVKEGDTITAWFLSSHSNEMRFTTKIGGSGAGHAQLEDAWRSGIPVEGYVEKEVKGGFEVKIAGSVRAFCPYSQIGLRRVNNPESCLGQRLSFRINEYGENGRNIVVSRRALLEEEQRQQGEERKASLQLGMTVTGTVTSLQKFGAFVDIGGIEGLLPVSEIAWGRVKDVGEALSVGEQVTVLVKQIDLENNRISFSLKETLADPWERVAEQYPEGSCHTGTVARLAPFGAFVTLEGGVDGLIHISKLGAGKRINHPREVLKEGESVEVKVEGVDRDQRRLSLSLAAASRAAEEDEAALAAFRCEAAEDRTKSLGSLGELFKAKPKKEGK